MNFFKIITRIEKKVIQEVLKAQALAQADGKKTKKRKIIKLKMLQILPII